MNVNPIYFLSHHPTLRNIGDELCTPKHYFKFAGNHKAVALVGGGVFDDFGAKLLKSVGVTPSDAVLWGAGRSVKRQGDALRRIATLPYRAWGLRDLDGVADAGRFLPCVSCLHPMLDQPSTNEGGTLLFLNADPRVTTPLSAQRSQGWAQDQGMTVLFNNCSDEAMWEALGAANSMVTNSFHGAYWGLLSGRKVKVVGYSSKFVSLLKGLGLDEAQMVRYEKPRKHRWWRMPAVGAESPLTAQLERVLNDGSPWLQLRDADLVCAQFRRANWVFAKQLEQLGLFEEVEPSLLAAQSMLEIAPP